jgi:hypothetical protein
MSNYKVVIIQGFPAGNVGCMTLQKETRRTCGGGGEPLELWSRLYRTEVLLSTIAPERPVYTAPQALNINRIQEDICGPLPTSQCQRFLK